MFANENKNFKKCGELLIDLNTSNKENKIFIFNCTFCNIEYDTLNKFGLHIEEHLNIGDVFKEAVIKFEAEPEEITISKYTNEEQFNEKVSSSFNTTTVIPGNKKAIERRKKDENNICVNSEQIVINTPLVVPSINKESVDDTNSIIIKKEISDYHTEPLVVKENKLEVYNNDEEFLDNTTFVIPTIKKEAESNDFTNTICIKEEIPESHVEGFVINEIKQEIENTESIDCVEEASNTEPKVDSDSTKIIEIVIKNSSAESDNETMEQIEQILGIKRKAKICSNDGKKLKSLKGDRLYRYKQKLNCGKAGDSFRELEYCTMTCKEKISVDKQQQIYTKFWNLGFYERRQRYIKSLIDMEEIKFYGSDIHPKTYTYKYYLEIPDENFMIKKIPVCKKCFMYTLNLTERFIRTALKNKKI